MRCPVCVEEKKTSTVRLDLQNGRWETVPAVYFEPDEFYDEDGRYHNHTGTARSPTKSFKCSNDHKFKVTKEPGCWCGHGRRPDLVQVGDRVVEDFKVLYHMFYYDKAGWP
jgi:hypothetical protein